VRVYCDMTFDDGGWTLVGRSGPEVPGTLPPFGWSSATGSVDALAFPYSLDVVTNHLTFTEVLVATQDSARAYKFAVGPAFLETKAGATTPGPHGHLLLSAAVRATVVGSTPRRLTPETLVSARRSEPST
jgi:hypothetical protein